jgi:dGTPase
MGSGHSYKTRVLGISYDEQGDGRGTAVIQEPDDSDGESASEDRSGRSAFGRDLDRLKYTKEFRRLKDVTQVARAGESYLYHDRLSHSLKVAQVGRRFAEYIAEQEKKSDIVHRELHPEMVEAACLAHDLGHPPFGHLAESTLDELLQEKTNPYRNENELDAVPTDLPDNLDPTDTEELDAYLMETEGEPAGIRFEGNAQSFRILTRLANHRDGYTGLSLTVGVLLGIGKYPYGRGEWFAADKYDSLDPWPDDPETIDGRSAGKFGFYEEDRTLSRTVRYDPEESEEFKSNRTAAAGVMDYADDLTYAIHDLTDFYMDGRVPLDRLLREAFTDLDGKNKETLEEMDYEQAPRRELEDLHEELDYDEEIATPTDVISSLVTTAILTGTSTETNLSLLEPFDGNPQQRNELEAFTSFLIEYYLNRIYYVDPSAQNLEDQEDAYITFEYEEDTEECELCISSRLEEQLSILQEITKYYVIRQPSMMAQQHGQEQIIRETFEALYEEAGKGDRSWSAVPAPYRDWLEDRHGPTADLKNDVERRARVITDFITSMTEPQLVALHKRLTGDNPGSLQNEIVR